MSSGILDFTKLKNSQPENSDWRLSKQRCRQLIWRFLFLLAIYQLLRLGYVAVTWSQLSELNFGELWPPILRGVRFDLAAIALTLSPLVLTQLIFLKGQALKLVLALESFYFLVTGLFFFGANVVDYELSQITGQRVTLSVFDLGQEIFNQSDSLIANHFFQFLWILVLFALAVIFEWKWRKRFFKIFLKQTKNSSSVFSSFFSQLGLGLLLVSLTILLARGGLQWKPLGVAHAYAQPRVLLGTLSLNSTFTLIHSRNRNQLSPLSDFLDEENQKYLLNHLAQSQVKKPHLWVRAKNPKDLEQDLFPGLEPEPPMRPSELPSQKTPPAAGTAAAADEEKARERLAEESQTAWPSERAPERPSEKSDQPKNLVLIIVESLSEEYIGFFDNPQSYTPFLDRLFKQSTVVSEGFANGRRSIDAFPAIFSSLPSLFGQSLIKSNYQSNEIYDWPSAFTKNGFETLFFHGAHNGSMNFESFAKRVGFQKYFGKDQYRGPASDYDGNWGIFDRPFFEFSIEVINQSSKPFFAGFFTLSSHHPYTLPESEKGRFPKGELPIHESLGYADFALESFFRKARQQSWYQDTLFVITADHTQVLKEEKYKDIQGPYRIPIAIFRPGFQPLELPRQRAQHIDIGPSLLDLFQIQKNKVSPLSSSFFSSSRSWNFFTEAGAFWFFLDENQWVQIKKSDAPVCFQKEQSKILKFSLQGELWRSSTKGDAPSNEEAFQGPQQRCWALYDLARRVRQAYVNGMVQNHLVWEKKSEWE